MKISQKGLYALQAMMMLARHYNQGAIRIRDIAYEEALRKVSRADLLELKNARMVEACAEPKVDTNYAVIQRIHLSEIMRLIDGPLAPFGDAEQLRSLIDRDAEHRALYQIFWTYANAAAKILEHTTLADIIKYPESQDPREPSQKRRARCSAHGGSRHSCKGPEWVSVHRIRRSFLIDCSSVIRTDRHSCRRFSQHHSRAAHGRKSKRLVRQGNGSKRKDSVDEL